MIIKDRLSRIPTSDTKYTNPAPVQYHENNSFQSNSNLSSPIVPRVQLVPSSVEETTDYREIDENGENITEPFRNNQPPRSDFLSCQPVNRNPEYTGDDTSSQYHSNLGNRIRNGNTTPVERENMINREIMRNQHLDLNTNDYLYRHPDTDKNKKVLILSDSICGRIDMNNLNRKIIGGQAFRQYHPGGTPKQLLHYCTHPLEYEKPDSVIINVGSNKLGKDDANTIADDIIDIVTRCQGYDVKHVHVSGITYRQRYQQDIKEINDMLKSRSRFHGYKFIPNNNISPRHIWKDKIHLSDEGSKILGDNFILSVNSERA